MSKAMTYAEQLRSPFWQRKRLEVLNDAGFSCERCQDAESTLHVHHKHYVKGRMAWEYTRQELAALCESCHAIEHQDDVERKAFLASLPMDGPASINDIISFGAGAAMSFVDVDVPEAARRDPHGMACGGVAAALFRLRLTVSGLHCFADLLRYGNEAFIADLLAVLAKHGINQGKGFED